MFHTSKKINFESKHKQAIFVGLILIFVAAMVALLILLNYYFTSKLVQIQNLTVENNQRIVQIENFLKTVEDQMKTQSQEKMQEDLQKVK